MLSSQNSSTITIRLKQGGNQRLGYIRRIMGLMPARQLIDVIDQLNLEANPRNSKAGNVTKAIIESIKADEASIEGPLFPFKTKGILLAASECEDLDRDRFRLTFHDLATEGILDGGHNTLAIGIYILDEATRATGTSALKRADYANWDTFKCTWASRRADIDAYLDAIRNSPETLISQGISLLKFDIPVELLVPIDPDDELCVDNFRTSLLEICDARNNNVQLTQGTKGNQEGLFEDFKALLKERYPELAESISWKTNDGKPIQSRSIVALSWVPLALTSWVSEGDSHILDAPSDTSIYSGKEKCLEKYLDLMRDDSITNATASTQRELKDGEVLSALKIACDLPTLYDKLYQKFPELYSGSYGKIGAVKSLMGNRDEGEFTTPFLGLNAKKPVPDGFLYPLVVGLRALMGRNEDSSQIVWLTDPFTFIEGDAFKDAVRNYSDVIQQSGYDPQKVGKGKASYTSAYQSIKLAYLLGK